MRKKQIAGAVFFIFCFILAYGESDFYSQKIGLMTEKNGEYSGIDTMVQKTVLSLAANENDIFIYPGDKNDLDILGVKEINGNVLIKTQKKGNVYNITLYLMDDKLVLLDNSIEIKVNQVVASIEPSAKKVLAVLKKQFPQKKKQELRSVDVVKMRFSEYESLTPTWSISVLSSFSTFSFKQEFSFESNSYNLDKTSTWYGSHENIIAELKYHEWIFDIGVGGMFAPSMVGFNSTLGAGWGIFGSLIILGLELNYYNMNFQLPDDMIIDTNNYRYTIPKPSVAIQSLSGCLYFRFNISKNYYFVFKGSPPLQWGNMSVRYNQSSYTDLNMPYLNSSNGPTCMGFLFSIGFAPRWRLILDYLYSSSGVDAGKDSNKDFRIYSSGTREIYVKQATIQEYQIGAGLTYEI